MAALLDSHCGQKFGGRDFNFESIFQVAGPSVFKNPGRAACFYAFSGVVTWVEKQGVHFAEHSGRNAI
jgi:hypothetical protein